MIHEALIQDLALVLAAAAAVAFLFHKLHQPVVVGYILAGTLIGPHSPLPARIAHQPEIQLWAELGVIFLMFHLGLEFSFRRLHRLGVSTIFTGIFSILSLIGLGWSIGKALGYPDLDRWFIGTMLAISSTTIIIKTLDELGLKTRRFAERVTGLLIFEDLAAILILVTLSTSAANQNFNGANFFYLVSELIIVVAGWYVVGTLVVPRLVRYVSDSKNDELLILFALGLCLILALAAARFHYSMALGAFIMGSILNESREVERIEGLIRPVRNVFAAVFFVSVGMLADLTVILTHAPVLLVLTFTLIVGKAIVMTLGSVASGQDLRTSLRVGLSMGQVGEFSFIIASLGITTGRMSPELQGLIVGVSLVTTLTTPYMIRAADPLSRGVERLLPDRYHQKLNRYQRALSSLRDERSVPRWLKPGLGRLILNGMLVALIFGAVRRYIRPLLSDFVTDAPMLQALTLALALICSGPFIYAMLSASQRRKISLSERVIESGARAFVFGLITILWIGTLSAQFLPAITSTLITLLLAVLVTIFSYRRLEQYYLWLESHFLSGLKTPDPENETQKAMRALTPWEAHMVSLIMHPNSPLVGRKLQECGLRESYDLIVIAIRRGDHLVGMPGGDEALHPGDELLVLGIDEQIEDARRMVEHPEFSMVSAQKLSDYEMRSIHVTEESSYAHLRIRQSGLREACGCFIVGLERGRERWVNPPAHLILLPGDTLWVVGPRTDLDQMHKRRDFNAPVPAT